MISHFWHHVLSSGYVSNNRKSNQGIWLECTHLINSILRNRLKDWMTILKDWMTRLKWKLLKILLFTVHRGSPRKSQVHIFESRSPQGFMRVTWKLFQSSSPRLHSYLIIHIVLRTKRFMPCMSDSIRWKLKGTLLQWCNSCLVHETYIVHLRVGFSVRWSSPSTHTCKTDLFIRLQFLPLFDENTHCWILLNLQNWWIDLCHLLTAH